MKIAWLSGKDANGEHEVAGTIQSTAKGGIAFTGNAAMLRSFYANYERISGEDSVNGVLRYILHKSPHSRAGRVKLLNDWETK